MAHLFSSTEARGLPMTGGSIRVSPWWRWYTQLFVNHHRFIFTCLHDRIRGENISLVIPSTLFLQNVEPQSSGHCFLVFRARTKVILIDHSLAAVFQCHVVSTALHSRGDHPSITVWVSFASSEPHSIPDFICSGSCIHSSSNID